MVNALQKAWRKNLILVCIFLMLVSLLISRAALSVSMIIFILLALCHRDLLVHFRLFIKDPILVGFSALFFIPFISGLWSTDMHTWGEVIRVKLPLLFFPVAFAGLPYFDEKNMRSIAAAFLLIVFMGCCYSLWLYGQDMVAANKAYLKAQVFDTPFDNDHVRFSWLVSAAVICCFLLIKWADRKIVKVLIYILATFFIVYLHLLSARTGLICTYIFLITYVIRQILIQKRSKALFLVVIILISIPFIAWIAIPTFHNRIAYIHYDISNIQKDIFLHGSNDGNRFLSLKAGWQVIMNYPFGAGAGDLDQEMNKWYSINYPHMHSEDKLNPCSEWLMYGGFAGWPGMILFTGIMLLPLFFLPLTHKFYWIMINLLAAVGFAFDMGLEVQYGVFNYAFILLWWYKWFNQNSQVQL
jgi:O-antigen ligase